MFPVTVALLAGGKSSRMGTDKSFVRVLGQPMIERVLARVAGLGAETLLVTNRPDDYAYLGLPLHGDVVPDAGSLGGLYSAVTYAAHAYTLVVACDMPFLSRALLTHLLALAVPAEGETPAFDVVVPRVEGQPEPLHAVYGKACLAPMRQRIDVGRLKVVGFYDEVRVRYVEEAELRAHDPELRSFRNVNTPEEAEEVNGQQAGGSGQGEWRIGGGDSPKIP